MKAKRISTGEEVEVSKLTFTNMKTNVVCRRDKKNGGFIAESDLEFLPDTPEEVTIEGWVTRSKNGKIVFSDSPECKRGSCVWYHKEGSNIVTLSETGLFDEGILPSVTWQSEPKKVKITITPMG